MTDEDIAFFLSWCIEEYASYKDIPAKEAARIFSQNGVLEYLSQNSEVLYTQGKSYILGSVEEFLGNKTAGAK